jgi:hypothetical protein
MVMMPTPPAALASTRGASCHQGIQKAARFSGGAEARPQRLRVLRPSLGGSGDDLELAAANRALEPQKASASSMIRVSVLPVGCILFPVP